MSLYIVVGPVGYNFDGPKLTDWDHACGNVLAGILLNYEGGPAKGRPRRERRGSRCIPDYGCMRGIWRMRASIA